MAKALPPKQGSPPVSDSGGQWGQPPLRRVLTLQATLDHQPGGVQVVWVSGVTVGGRGIDQAASRRPASMPKS